MSRINILSEQVSNRIAAGEVIERPASVVKELVENSIDAGATNVIIAIEKAGSKSITITDNGSGMDADDALLCFEQHATSKISSEDDINTIMTFGFRGEAVPSIASVSKFHLKTRQKDSLEGMEVVVHGGKFVKESPAGCAPGTEIIIRDLFFNIPARKKFLKTQATEERHIQEMLLMLTLANPTVGFELKMDNRKVFTTPGHKNLRPRIQSFFGKSVAEQMMEVDFEDNGIRVKGFVSQHGFTRNTRREQRTFVNGRPVEAFALYQGIKDGYGNLVEKGRFPPVILFVELDPLLVDVNVHPAKREVRFRKELILRQVVAETIQRALRDTDAPTVSVDPALSLKNILDGAEVHYETKVETPELQIDHAEPENGKEEFPQTPAAGPGIQHVKPRVDASRLRPVTNDKEFVKQPVSNLQGLLEAEAVAPTLGIKVPEQPEASTTQTAAPQPAVEQKQPEVNPDGFYLPGSGPMLILGFIDETYILASSERGLIVIDQHAAHERVLFERILKAKEEGEQGTQGLLIPITIELSRIETIFVEKNAEVFEKVGFDVQMFSENTIMVNSIPAGVSQNNAGGFFRDLLGSFTESGSISRKVNYDAVAMAACKAAVKAHDRLTMNEAKSLLKQMAECDLPFSCPHGRPTIINIGVKELEKRFGRK